MSKQRNTESSRVAVSPVRTLPTEMVVEASTAEQMTSSSVSLVPEPVVYAGVETVGQQNARVAAEIDYAPPTTEADIAAEAKVVDAILAKNVWTRDFWLHHLSEGDRRQAITEARGK